MFVFEHKEFDNHEKVAFFHDKKLGLSAIIAVHSTALGPGAGGVRQWAYKCEADALTDVLRLSKAMSYKNAMAGLRFGGGKAIIIDSPQLSRSDKTFERFGEFVESMGGDYITGEDVGMTLEKMVTIAEKTKHVTGLPLKPGKAGGDPSPKTALGIYSGIQAAAEVKLGVTSLRGLRVAVQGVGNVGYNLCKLLHQAGASLIISNLDIDRAKQVVNEFSATLVGLDEIISVEADIFSPCALGAILNEKTIPQIKAPIVAGGANNQLATPEDGKRLSEAGILYAPDYVINAGGIINIASEYYGDFDDEGVNELAQKIGPRLREIFEESSRTGQATSEISDRMARDVIAKA